MSPSRRGTPFTPFSTNTYDDVVYRAAPGAATVVQRTAAGIDGGERVHVRPYPPPTLSQVA